MDALKKWMISRLTTHHASHHHPKEVVLLNTFLYIILAAKWLLRHPAAMTFAFPSVFILILWCKSSHPTLYSVLQDTCLEEDGYQPGADERLPAAATDPAVPGAGPPVGNPLWQLSPSCLRAIGPTNHRVDFLANSSSRDRDSRHLGYSQFSLCPPGEMLPAHHFE